MKPFLILQLRPETEASDGEYSAFLAKGGLAASDTHRIRLDQQDLPENLNLRDYSGVIIGGGPGCVSDAPEQKTATEKRVEDAALGLMPAIIKDDIPFLGCCYGIGILAHHLGATVSKEKFAEPVGPAACTLTPDGKSDPLLRGIPDEFAAFVGHKEAVQALPQGCTHLVTSPTCPLQMIRLQDNIYATQFHPEADGAGFEVRINIYRNRGYFPPEDAARLIKLCRAADVQHPEKILRNFVRIYGQP